MDIAGKVAFITGAGSGIGRASACAFARAGASVMIVDMNESGLMETAGLIEEIGGAVATMTVDVTDGSSVAAAVAATVERFGRLDCAHNNAGVGGTPAELAESDEASARQVMDVNFWGVFHGMRAQIAVMLRQGGGTIVNTASAAGLVGLPSLSVYSASKHAVVGLTKTAALEYATRGIRINSVCPGVIETPMSTPLFEVPGLHAAMAAVHPIGRFGLPTEIADAVLWLSSSASSFVVGASIAIDGGSTAQ
ncbi:glucose 1-dehydrogenase [Sphingomonas panacis]|nr:glucose 1-dehydrogenase [Sphingomonas panacis]